MATLKEEAQTFEPKQTKNIADLPEVSTDFQVIRKVGKDNNGVEFQYMCLEINGLEYRLPGKVLGDLKIILKENPNLKRFKVVKTGTGLETRYTVIPLS